MMNTAAALSASGKRVLVVDFDLEAPGLCSYPELNEGRGRPGIVEYVTGYLANNSAPVVDDFVTACRFGDNTIWLMPAGDVTDPTYSEKLAAINWEHLYSQRSGYLMFEDLKQQWEAYEDLGFDYVFVDSRTGHTDVGGICTRQLPNAVVMLFLPTEQNVDGLVPMVEAIRNEAAAGHRQPIHLHFCPSNVPTLDDEDNILSEMFAAAKRRLKYDEVDSCIHHYNSLDLLRQSLFTINRKNTSLAKEYVRLRDAVVAQNINDRDGALVALQRAIEVTPRNFAAHRVGILPLDDIQSQHGNDAEVAAHLALAYGLVGDDDRQLASLDVAIAAGFQRVRGLAMRATCLRRLGRREDSLKDWFAVLGADDAPAEVVVRAINAIREMDPDGLVRAVDQSSRVKSLGNADLRRVVATLSTSEVSIPAAARLVDQRLSQPDLSSPERAYFIDNQKLALIRMRRFDEAMSLISTDRAKIETSTSIHDVFNYAMAEWGKSGNAPKDLFLRVIELDDGTYSRLANFRQCMAVAHFISGEVSATARELKAAKSAIEPVGRSFSCWSYLELPKAQFLEDIRDMERALSVGGKAFTPKFLQDGDNLFTLVP